MTESTPIEGFVAPGYEAARSAFAENFDRPGPYQEVGAALTAYHRGDLVVDLWGGWADAARTRPWQGDTLVNVWSATKGAVATALAVLVDRRLIAYDDTVASVWPQFAQAGKSATTIGQVVAHQAGLPGFAEPTSIDDQFDFAGCAAKLERQAPQWPPGTQTSYHAMTFGWLVGEIIRRASGRSPGMFLADTLAGPLAADIFIGLDESLESRVAETLPPRHRVDMDGLDLPDAAMMALNNPRQDPSSPNRRAWRAAEIPAANGHASARGLARLYAALVGGGALDGVRILTPTAIARMTVQAAPPGRQDMFLGFVDAWGMGLALNRPGIYGPSKRAYGHSGWGGSFGCADPDAGVAIGYVCNQMGPELVGDPRTTGLCKAVLDSARG
jgi:CubicO group peptidase (beta-lactamase class C family)